MAPYDCGGPNPTETGECYTCRFYSSSGCVTNLLVPGNQAELRDRQVGKHQSWRSTLSSAAHQWDAVAPQPILIRLCPHGRWGFILLGAKPH
jgi:hypothetical protein